MYLKRFRLTTERCLPLPGHRHSATFVVSGTVTSQRYSVAHADWATAMWRSTQGGESLHRSGAQVGRLESPLMNRQKRLLLSGDDEVVVPPQSALPLPVLWPNDRNVAKTVRPAGGRQRQQSLQSGYSHEWKVPLQGTATRLACRAVQASLSNRLTSSKRSGAEGWDTGTMFSITASNCPESSKRIVCSTSSAETTCFTLMRPTRSTNLRWTATATSIPLFF